MAAVRSPREMLLNRVAIVGVFLALIVMLGPIYWIAATSFKPRNLATTVPPTDLFEPTVAPGAMTTSAADTATRMVAAAIPAPLSVTVAVT